VIGQTEDGSINISTLNFCGKGVVYIVCLLVNVRENRQDAEISNWFTVSCDYDSCANAFFSWYI